MGTFLLYNFQRQSSLDGAGAFWQGIFELQQKNGAWTHSLVHCKLPVRAILKAEDLEKSSNYVSFLLVPCGSSAPASLGLEPHVFQQTRDKSWKACLWIPGCEVPVVSAPHVVWTEFAASLDSEPLSLLRDGLKRCNDALLQQHGLSKPTKQKMAKAQSSFQVGQGAASVVKCNDVRQTLEAYLTSSSEATGHWSNTPACLCEQDPQPSFGWLRSNFAETRSASDALLAMRRDYQEKAWVWGQFGAATLWARASTVFIPPRKPGKKTKITGTRLLMHADNEERPDSLSRTDCQHHMIWIAALDVCEREAAADWNQNNASLPSETSFYRMGVRRMVSSVGFRSSSLFVKPPLQSLPGHGPVLNGAVVLTVLLSDMHEYVFLDHAMQQVVRGLPRLQDELHPLACVSSTLLQILRPQKTHCALRAWLGIGSPSAHRVSTVWSSLLGAPGSRSSFLVATQEALQVQWSPDQEEALQKIIAPVTLVEAPVGAGKSKLCVALSHKLAEDGLVLVVSDTKALCAEHYAESIELCQRQNQKHTVARLGFDEQGRGDFFSAYLKEVSKNIMQDAHIWSLVGAIDLCLELLGEELTCAHNPTVATTLLQLGCQLLAWRHEYLHEVVYVAKAQAERTACRGLRILFMTGSMYLKAKGDLAQWSWSFVGAEKRLRILIDECHKFSREQVTAMCADAEVLVLLGNYGQGPSENSLLVPLAQDSFAQLNDRQVKNSPPINWHPSITWARDQKSVDVITLTGTWRSGRTVVELWRKVLPERFGSVYSLRQSDTLFFPFFSDGPGDWKYNDEDLLEAQRSEEQFSCILLALCIELVLAATMPELPKGLWVLMVTTLQTVQDNLMEYLWWNVPRLCWKVHEAFDISEPIGGWVVYDYAELVQQSRLSMRGCKSVGGLTGRVTMVVAPTPNSRSTTWAGDMTEPHLLGQFISRSTLRLYVFGQDMRRGIVLPSAGPLKQEGLDCGVPECNVQTEGTPVSQSSLKKQLHWARLLRHVQDVTAPALGIPTHAITGSGGRISCPLFGCKAFLASISSGRVSKTRLSGELHRRLQDLLQQCQVAFSEVGSWPVLSRNATLTQTDFFKSRRALSAALQNEGCQRKPKAKPYDSPEYDLRPYFPAGQVSVPSLQWNNPDEDEFEAPVERRLVLNVWKPFCIPAISVTGHAADDLVVVIPVAAAWCSRFASSVSGPSLAEDARAHEPEWLCRELSAHAFLAWQDTSAADTLRAASKITVSETVKRHKKTAVMVNGLVHWIPLCNSERPAFVWEAVQEGNGNGLDPVQELLHLYCAMGLEHASDLQLSLVGRCKDVSVAAALVRAAMHCLDAKFHSSGMRFLTGEESTDAQTEAAFKASLQEVDAPVSMCRPPLSRAPIPSEYTEAILSEPRNAVHKVAFLTSAAKALGMADRFSAVIGSLRCHAPPSTSTQLVAAVDRSPEPAVQYPSLVRWFCRSKPAQIAIPGVESVVLLGSLAHAIDEEWLRWRGVSHIVCCLGKFAGGRSVHEAWSLAEQSRKQGIKYLEWNPSYRGDWDAVASYCACLHDVLGSRGSVVLFHCVNGKDRSPMAVFAYMRLRLGMAADVALQLLEARRGTDEKPLFDLYANDALPYLTTALEQASEWGVPRVPAGQRRMEWSRGHN